MLIKEYRICLPLSVDEYRIAQLYMIQKKSREESEGTGSGVEILVNEPYSNGPGGSGQYTKKIYHIGSHLPSWFRAVLPKSALQVDEEAWNAYPYTKTIYRCPFIEKFLLEIETRYFNDNGSQENVFNLTAGELHSRVVDNLDIVKDPITGGDYRREEDPRVFRSVKTGRGPLSENWIQEYSEACLSGRKKKPTDKAIMCAYKLCKVEFKYWGMQSKIERFIHDVGLRKTMLRAHRQAWSWQDEYYGLTIEDIRRLERETQLALAAKMATGNGDEDGRPEESSDDRINGLPSITSSSAQDDPLLGKSASGISISTRKASFGSVRSKLSQASKGSTRNLADWQLDNLEQLATSSSDEDEFFDAPEDVDDFGINVNPRLIRSSSMEMMREEDFESLPGTPDEPPLRSERYHQLKIAGGVSLDSSTHLTGPPQTSCSITLLMLILHGGSILETGHDQQGSKLMDLSTLKATVELVIRAHYPTMHRRVAIRLVSCPAVCSETLTLLTSLNPCNFDGHSSAGGDSSMITSDAFPLGAIALFATGCREYYDSVVQVVTKTNAVYNEFLRSDEGLGFSGQVCLIGDSVGSLLGYDALCKNNPYVSTCGIHCCRSHSTGTEPELDDSAGDQVFRKTQLETIKQLSVSNPDLTADCCPGQPSGDCKKKVQSTSSYPGSKLAASCPASRRTSTGSNSELGRFDFEVCDFFMMGAPLALVLAFRRMCMAKEKSYGLPRPQCHQIYNLFYPTAPSAIRLEPLLHHRFQNIPPMKVPRYQKFPMGDGQSNHVVETITSHSELFLECSAQCSSTHSEHPQLERRHSNMSISSQISGHGELTVANVAAITHKWWGSKRLDYALYQPEGLASFRTSALPCLLHAAFWESTDVIAFILRQVIRSDYATSADDEIKDASIFKPGQPREKWLKRRTTIKLRNVTPNHRGNDVIVLEDRPQILSARFLYGPLDMVCLSGEKVDIHIMTKPPSGEWVYFATEVTDSNGRVSYTIPENLRLPQGMYPIKMVVRGDHTSVDFYLTILPPKTETVLFSIDGSFTASMSIMGKDPKVRAGAVDVVRHYQELGYLLWYVTARPDMQQNRVVAWLAQHNFPHGMVGFMDGLSADPLRQKANYIKTITQEAQLKIHAAYGSAKDIWVYSSLGLQPSQIFVVGKASKRQTKEAEVLLDGYASHLNDLTAPGGSHQAVGNARFFLRKSCFSLPCQLQRGAGGGSRKGIYKSKSLSRTLSGGSRESTEATSIIVTEQGNTLVEATSPGAVKAVRSRGISPRAKLSAMRFDSSHV